ncbi:MAG: flagellar biosynthesis anti-sigma factor FlgM [Lachnospiraceae bacterium]|uniref:Flagellar biosynthesis anti-sigma factor FlgM n=1 Tax=Candidatus Weimeria bifida TaxID=2599074 RepID=A0A6N7J0U3_9FIRM|nr:flagellar biosynthesis anti-sigma factor FlgM [Candidatus Weimeria bifida]RRF97398.1 MAG: flagellar biosynthesis anti-sigma factor FlgM [Lachnospiraceae bacterium]
MRISAYNAITQVYQARKPSTAKTKRTSGFRDEVDISEAGKDYQIAKKAVSESSDTRKDLVSEMKKKYAGDVKVDTLDFADVLLQKAQGLKY